MPNRTRTVASAIVCASVIATSISFASFGTAHAVDECLSAPKGSAPAGAHWYYRSDRQSKRKCWYLADIPKPEKATSQRSAASSAQPADTKLSPATANARAELPPEPPPVEQPAVTAAAEQPPPAPPANPTPDQMARDSLAAALRAAAQPDVNRDVVIADDSVNVEPAPDTQAEPPPRAAPVQLAAAQPAPETAAPEATTTGMAAAKATTRPLRDMFGWILIGLGLVIFAGGLIVKLTSARPERQHALST